MKNMILSIMLFGMLAFPASATLKLDNILFDPAIIAAGDEVDIVIQYHHESITEEDERVGSKDYTFQVILEPDDTLTQKYVVIQDAEGDDEQGRIFASGYYNKRFRVKVMPNAVPGNYEFKLTGQWFRDGEPDSAYQYLRFTMPVKKEGIILDLASFVTVPAEVRPGDNFVKIVGYIENAGEKDAKSIEIQMKTPDGIDASYANNNRVWAGLIGAGESKEVTFYVDVDEKADEGVYDLQFDVDYMDLDNNRYQKLITIPFLVKPRPYLEIVKSEGEGLSGSSGKLYITVMNTGSESAEAVDIRLLKQNSQPFNMDVRSDYIGELEPGEEGLAVFNIDVTSEAEPKEHYFKVLIRSKGDSDEGDDNIYTYNRRATFSVTGEAPNNLRNYGLAAAAVIAVVIVITMVVKK